MTKIQKEASIWKNYFYNSSYQIFKIIIPIILTPYISRILGVEGNGLYSYVNSIVAYFILVGNLGIESYAQIQLSKERQSKKKLNDFFWKIFRIRFLLFLLSSIIYVLFVLTKVQKNSYVYYLMGIMLVSQMFVTEYLYFALEQFKKIAIRNYIVKLLNLAGILIFVHSSKDLWIYILLLNGTDCAGQLWMFFQAIKIVGRPQSKLKLQDLKYIKNSMAYFIAAIASTVTVYIDKVMLGALISNNYQNGIYAQPEKVYQLILTVISSLLVVMRPRLVFDLKNNNIKKFNYDMMISSKICILIMLPISLGILAVSDYFVLWFFGKSYAESILILKIFCIIMIIRTFSLIYFESLLVSERMSLYSAALIIGMFANIFLNLYFISNYYAVGAAIASLFSECIVLIALILMNRKTNILKKIWKISYKYLVSSVLMCLICIKLMQILHVNSTLPFLMVCIIGIMIYIISLVLFRDEFFINILKKKKGVFL